MNTIERIKRSRAFAHKYHSKPVYDGLVLVLGIESTYLLSYLTSLYDSYDRLDRLDVDGFFYRSAEDIERDTTITYFKQKRHINMLEGFGLLEQKRKRVLNGPLKEKDARNIIHFRINIDVVENLLDNCHNAIEQKGANLSHLKLQLQETRNNLKREGE